MRELQSDRGTHFTGEVVEELLKYLGIRHRYTPPYRPQANGSVERVNAEVLKHLKAIVFDSRVKHRWSVVLPLVKRILDTTVHSVTGQMPMRLLYGDFITPQRGFVTEWGSEAARDVADYGEHVQRLTDSVRAILEASRAHQDTKVAARMAQSAEKPTTFAVGTHVLASYPVRAPSKLHPPWRGPFVVEAVSGQQYVCVDVFTGKTHDFHVTRLKEFLDRGDLPVGEVAIQDHDMYIVESIVGHRGASSGRVRDLFFKLRWSGYGEEDDSWVPWRDCRELALLPLYLDSEPALRKFKRHLRWAEESSEPAEQEK